MTAIRFGVTLPAQTEAATDKYVAEFLDPQIEELRRQLGLLQSLRRAIAETFGIDRREDAGTFGRMADAAKRAELEGDETEAADGRMKPAGTTGPAPLENRRVPRPVPDGNIVHRHTSIAGATQT